MEHRLGRRTNTKLSVCFYKDGVPVAIGKTRNIAPGGVFVETAYRPDNGARCIEIAFIVRNDIAKGFDPVNALIIHRTKEGFGLMIDQFDSSESLPLSIPNVLKHDALKHDTLKHSALKYEPINRLRQL